MRSVACTPNRNQTANRASLTAFTQQPFQRRGAKLLSFTREPREILAGVPRLVLRFRQRQSFQRCSVHPCPARRTEGEPRG